jgi:hypothetical protein
MKGRRKEKGDREKGGRGIMIRKERKETERIKKGKKREERWR